MQAAVSMFLYIDPTTRALVMAFTKSSTINDIPCIFLENCGVHEYSLMAQMAQNSSKKDPAI